jgi:hypothetical protein
MPVAMLKVELGTENLVDPADESERRQWRVATWIERECAHRGGAVTVENQRLRGARIIDACKRIDLRLSQTLRYGVVGGRDRAFESSSWPKIQ